MMRDVCLYCKHDDEYIICNDCEWLSTPAGSLPNKFELSDDLEELMMLMKRQAKQMVHDINQYGVMIMPKSNATLKAMTKAELIDYIRTLEHNYNVAVEFNERQARNIEAKMKEIGG